MDQVRLRIERKGKEARFSRTLKFFFVPNSSRVQMRRVALLAVCFLLASTAVHGQQPLSAIVSTEYGLIQGLMDSRFPNVSDFLGVPFAAPPIGQYRFVAPQPAGTWTGVRNATAWSAGCMNSCGLPRPRFTCTPTVSEDCLYLNVYTPAQIPTSAPLPVLAFIHGGGFTAGSGGTPIYEAAKLAFTQNIVVVTFNYRLGVFGALYLGAEVPGNFMFADQRMALQWVQRNIAAFGGDPSRVTLGGESAGAISVGAHMVSPNSQGLFQAAYMSSNPYGLLFQTVDLALALGASVLEAAGCSSTVPVPEQLSCLQGVSADEMLAISNNTRNSPWPPQDVLAVLLPWTGVVVPGSDDVPVQPFLAAGNNSQQLSAGIPILIGTNANDSIPFVYALSANPVRQEIFDVMMAYIFGVFNAIDIRLMYGDAPDADARVWFSRIATDYIFYCATRNVTRRLAAGSPGSNIYQYVFGHKPSFAKWMWAASDNLCVNHICHADDVPFVFDNLHVVDEVVPTPSPNERQFISWLQGAIGEFVREGRMHRDRGWTPYTATSDSVMWLDDKDASGQYAAPTMRQGHHDEYCAMYDDMGYNRH